MDTHIRKFIPCKRAAHGISPLCLCKLNVVPTLLKQFRFWKA